MQCPPSFLGASLDAQGDCTWPTYASTQLLERHNRKKPGLALNFPYRFVGREHSAAGPEKQEKGNLARGAGVPSPPS